MRIWATRRRRRRRERSSSEVTFEYNSAWLADPRGQVIFGSIGDSAPDTWGRRLMQRAERRRAGRDDGPVRTLAEADYLLGVSDETGLGALRFRWTGDPTFQAPAHAGVPALVDFGRVSKSPPAPARQ